MSRRIRQRFVWVLLLAGILSLRSEELEVHPWCGHNAVLPMGRVDFDRSARREWLSGSLSGSLAKDRDREIRVGLSIRPKEWVEPRFSEPLGRNTAARTWKLESWHDLVPESLTPGTPFNIRLAIKPRRSEPETVLEITNVVAGPVWVVLVQPELDQHDLPPISEAADLRVRLLPLERLGGGWTSPGWISPRSASTLTNHFCGLPRALAEQLAKSAPKTTIYGLVLVQAGNLSVAPQARGEFDVGAWQPTDRSETHSYLVDFISAAKSSNFAPEFGASVRHNNLQLRHLAILADLKREGILGEEFNKPVTRWNRFIPGDSDALPFRIHGIVR